MHELKEIILALGSNTDQESNLALAKELLKNMFDDVKFTRYLWTSPIDIDSDRFLNCLAMAHTRHGYSQVHRALKQLERQIGNSKVNRSKGIVKIDVDVLQYDDIKYHLQDWSRDYVQELLKEIRED